MPCEHLQFESRVKVSDVEPTTGLYALEVAARCTTCKQFLQYAWATPLLMPGQSVSASQAGTLLRVLGTMPGQTDDDSEDAWHALPPGGSAASQGLPPSPADEGGAP